MRVLLLFSSPAKRLPTRLEVVSQQVLQLEPNAMFAPFSLVFLLVKWMAAEHDHATPLVCDEFLSGPRPVLCVVDIRVIVIF